MKEANNLQAGRDEKRSRRNSAQHGTGKRILISSLVTAGILLAGVGGAYAWKAQQYQAVFFPNTIVNGVDASGKDSDAVKQLINSGIEGYVLTITGRGGDTAEIRGEEIGLHSEFDGSLEQMLTNQSIYQWGRYQFEDTNYQIETMVAYDSELFKQRISALKFFDQEYVTLPQNAYISDYMEGRGYEIIPETKGNLLDQEIALQGLYDAVLNLQTQLSLEELGAYVEPEITSTDTDLLLQLDDYNKYYNMEITHQFGAQTETISGDKLHQWVSFDADGGVIVDQDGVTEYVAWLAKQYNTAYQPKTFETSYGTEVKIVKGHYGWRINQSAEVAAICEIIRSGESQIREPIYSQTAASRKDHDYGDTYVEINLTAQHLFFYKDGKLLIESDFVSGNDSRGWGTPGGAYPITYKQRNATLKGEGYATPVSYWMPFNGNIGMHDASWRGSFGGSIYKTNGSHGCINLPPAVAKTIYENIAAGMPVLCYHLEGSNQGTTSTPAETTSPAPTTATEATTPVETLPEVTEPQVSSPAIDPSESGAATTEALPESSAASELPSISPAESEAPAATSAPRGPGEVETSTTKAVGPGV